MANSAIVSELLHVMSVELKGMVESPRREAELLMMAYLECDTLFLITNADYKIDDSSKLLEWTRRRKNYEPLEYITNTVSFYSEIFYIQEGALIPRPETELLIDEVLKRLNRDTDKLIVEVGVGSGIISIILARHLKNARFIAVDISEKALHVTRKNLIRFNLEDRVELRLSNLLESVPENIDILVSNPPYIANEAVLEKNLSYEPQNALFGGEIGDELIKELCTLTCKRKIDMFACEMGYDQKEKISAFIKQFEDAEIQFYKDYANFDRGFIMSCGEKYEK
jgi:release factor glutamine methyltransferase